jgi:hypothetical protein
MSVFYFDGDVCCKLFPVIVKSNVPVLKQYAMKAYGGEWSVSRCGHFTSFCLSMGNHFECTSGIRWLMVCSENE